MILEALRIKEAIKVRIKNYLKVKCCFDFYLYRKILRFEYLRKEFLSCLNRSLCPAVLLGFKCIHVYRELCVGNKILKIDELPSFKLCSVTKIKVFCKRVVLPPSRRLYTLPS